MSQYIFLNDENIEMQQLKNFIEKYIVNDIKIALFKRHGVEILIMQSNKLNREKSYYNCNLTHEEIQKILMDEFRCLNKIRFYKLMEIQKLNI